MQVIDIKVFYSRGIFIGRIALSISTQMVSLCDLADEAARRY
jgi:hypothetical protein